MKIKLDENLPESLLASLRGLGGEANLNLVEPRSQRALDLGVTRPQDLYSPLSGIGGPWKEGHRVDLDTWPRRKARPEGRRPLTWRGWVVRWSSIGTSMAGIPKAWRHWVRPPSSPCRTT